MTRLAIAVEGATETQFVNRVLAPHLWERSVYPFPISLDGNVSVARLASRMAGLLHSADQVTSLVDFYGFRRRNATTSDELERRIDQAVSRITRSSDQPRTFSYVQQYEFEGLLFSDVSAFAVLGNVPENMVQLLHTIRSRFQTPEDINDNPNTAPSKRIKQVIPRYDKRGFGYLVAEEIGLDKIRAECPRFNEWVTRLEALAGPSNQS